METPRIQNAFIGGLSQFLDSTRLQENQYSWLSNGRVRFGTVKPVQLPEDFTTGLPVGGVIQGGIDTFGHLFVFVNGNAYHRDLAGGSTTFVLLPGWSAMDATADIFCERVEASTINYKRESADGNATAVVNLTDPIDGSEQCIVVQNRVNQPRIIAADLSTRIVNNYNDWDKDTDREYVPIGGPMLFHDGVLYTISVDGSEVYRSVSGRPLDHMITITSDGDKLPNEVDGGAHKNAIKPAYGTVTCLGDLDTDDGAIFIGMETASYVSIPKDDEFVWAEPLYRNIRLSPKGVVNSHSFSRISGNTVFITPNGIESFDAIARKNQRGSTEVFSLQIARALEGIAQNVCAVGRLGDYYLFSLDTIYGPRIAVFDNLLNVFVSLDAFPTVVTSAVKQFINVQVNNTERLFAITVDSQLVEMYSGATSDCQLYVGDWVEREVNDEVYVTGVTCSFHKVFEDGTYSANPTIDGEQLGSRAEAIESVTEEAYPKTPPFGNAVENAAVVSKLDFRDQEAKGRRFGALIEWDFDAELSAVQVDTVVLNSEITDDDAVRACQANETSLDL